MRQLKQSTLKQAELFGREKAAPGAPNQEHIATAYCIEFSEDLKKCTRFLLEPDITVLAVPSKEIEPGASSASPITMISVGWLHEYMSGVYTPLLDSWAGTTVLVLAVGADSEFSDFAHHHTDVTIVAVRICAGEDKRNATLRLPDKTLFNIGLDAARTDVVMLMPNNMRFPATEQTRADLREMEPHLQRAGSPVAIVIPAVSVDAEIQEDTCGSDQPQAFKFLSSSKSELSSRTPLVFHAQVSISQIVSRFSTFHHLAIVCLAIIETTHCNAARAVQYERQPTWCRLRQVLPRNSCTVFAASVL